MKILGIENVSFVDYEGKMCATIFTAGCNYRCPFCHNAGIVLEEYKSIDEDKILDYLKTRVGLLDAVTISGGEPTLQKDLPQFIKKVREFGYKIKLDTNGTNPQILQKLIEEKLIDYCAVDIKTNFSNYADITKVENPLSENVKKSISILKSSGIDYELRTTLIAEFHNENVISKMAEELSGHKKLFLQKFKNSDGCINSSGLSEVKKPEAEKFKDILSKTITEVYLRGY